LRLVYANATLTVCGPSGGRICVLNFFDDRRYVPKTGSDMTDEQLAHLVGQYWRNQNTNYEEMLFSCRIYNVPDKCF
jgi:hypothetical protein